MSGLDRSMMAEVAEACRARAAEIAETIGRTFGQNILVEVGQPDSLKLKQVLAQWSGPGLVVVLTVEHTGALFAIPDPGALLPAWCRNPDATGKSKLATLAQELGMLLLPDRVIVENFAAGYVKRLAGVVDRVRVAPDAVLLPFPIQWETGNPATAWLVWPVSQPAKALQDEEVKTGAAPIPEPSSSIRPTISRDALPPYAKSLLRIKIPVVVTLAEKRQRLGQILKLAPGSIIQFEKSCEEMLDLDASGVRLAKGEAVKVGDKFGLRIVSIVLPEERFIPVGKCRAR